MSFIKILDTHTINKIAAGEVVERPSSVVKELVENSVDAKASSITVEIKNGGIDFIRVTDNGVGIPKDEVEVAFLRHATSKINTAEDLMEVLTLGFRGEALASIAAVSHVELITKEERDITGKRVEINGGKIVSSEEIACPSGTTFIMRHLFYNVPARKEFLGSSGGEGAKISDYLSKLALAHPEISFKYIQNSKLVFSTSGSHDLVHCVLNIYGKETAKNTMPFHYETNGLECVGLLGNTTLVRANRNYEHFFINGRYIKSKLLERAVEAAYKTLVMIGKFPFIILHLRLDPCLIDVNVHPTKMQVRFKNEDFIYKAVSEGILQRLREENLIPSVQFGKVSAAHHETPASKPEQILVDTFFTPRRIDNVPTAETMLPAKQELKTKQELPTQQDVVFKEEPMPKQKTAVKEENLLVGEERLFGLINETTSETSYASQEPLASYRVIGELFNTYWLIQYGEKVFLMDQHAAHERVMYEKFMADFKKGEVATQLLLIPEVFTLTDSEWMLLEGNAELFLKLGYKCEPFGENKVVMREVPFIFNQPLSAGSFKDTLDQMVQNKPEDLASTKEDVIIRMACRSAIKAHDKISDKECERLIESLFELDNPFTCPHGRPTLVALTKSDIEKMFKRIP